jgi:GUN4-like
MPKILIENSENHIQSIDSLTLKSSLEHLVNLFNPIGQDGGGGLGLDEVTLSIKVSDQGEVILLNGASTEGAMTLKFKRSSSFSPIASSMDSLQTIPQISYQRLETQLINGQWQEANLETWHLLCNAIQKPQGTPLSSADLDKVPCTVLNNIDKLWHKYSNGKFGFAIQSRISKENQIHGK